MDWWDGLFAFNNTGFNTSQTTNNTVYKAPKAKTYKVYNNTYDKWGFAEKDRKEPPKALFFSREGTKSLVVEGPWEEVHLKQVEINCWNNKKRGTGIISTENNTKTAEMDESKAFLEQNDEFKGYRG